jgi:deazaflavin-dependent oxidoreductase (nitroreductase family)
MSTGNRITMAMLRSPLHRIMSHSLLVLSYEGRKSGRHYELPLQYVELDDTVVILAGDAPHKTWWRNFETPAMVTMRLRGHDVEAKAKVVDAPDEKARYLRAYLERYPYTTETGRPKFLGERWHPDDAEIERVAGTWTWVGITRS